MLHVITFSFVFFFFTCCLSKDLQKICKKVFWGDFNKARIIIIIISASISISIVLVLSLRNQQYNNRTVDGKGNW